MALRLLFVSHDPDDYRTCAHALMREGWFSTWARTAAEGLVAATPDHHCIVVDWRIPDIGGFAFVASLRDRGVRTRIIAIAVDRRRQSAIGALRLGVTESLDSPLEPEALISMVTRWRRTALPHDPKVAIALGIIAAGFRDTSLSLRQVADQVGVSPEYLCRLLRSHTGVTCQQHIVAARLRNAEHLLWSTTLSVKEIAAASGFTTTAHMDRWFRRIHGGTPSEYRAVKIRQ